MRLPSIYCRLPQLTEVMTNQFGHSILEDLFHSSFSIFIWAIMTLWEPIFLFWQLWKFNAPLIVAFFAWEIGRDYILAIDKLMRGKILVNGCFLYKRKVESCNNILFWCPLVCKLWTMTYGFLRISWVMAGSVREEIWAWKREKTCKSHSPYYFLDGVETEEHESF